MLFDKDMLNDALENLGSNYRKILLVNLTKDSYKPITIADDEWSVLKDKSYKMSEYWKWFCNSQLVHPDDKQECLDFKLQANGHIVYRRYIDNEWRWVLMEIVPSHDYSEVNKCCVLYVRDIHSIYMPEYESVVEQIGTTDSFTGLYNKFAFQRDKLKHKDGRVGIIYLDLNGLKFTNDTFGHKAGDDLIMQLTSLMVLNFPSYKCYHLSGDEFLVCAFNQSLREFLVKAIAFHKSMWWSMEHPIASMGYAIGEEGEIDLALEEAEKGMYDDKRIFYQRFPKYKRK